MTEKLDIYSFIGSDEIREYMREHKVFSALDKARIIIFSFRPLVEKIDALKLLEDEILDINGSIDEDITLINQVIGLLREVLDYIKNPDDNHIYNITSRNAYWEDVRCNSYEKSISAFPGQLYKSFDDYISDYGVINAEKYVVDNYKNDRYEDLEYICGDIYNIENIGNNTEELSFEAAYFNGCIQIYHVVVSNKWAKERGYSKETVNLIAVSNLDRYSLPFKHGESVMIKTPFMYEPIYGGLYASMDGNGSWYYFLYYESENGLELFDLSYHEINFCDHLSVLDWLYRSKDVELSDSVKDELFGEDYSDLSSIMRIADIKDEGFAKVYCSVKVNNVDDYLIDVTISDDSGEIDGKMCVSPDDNIWIKELEKTEEKIIISGYFIKNENDDMFMEHHSDVYRIKDD